MKKIKFLIKNLKGIGTVEAIVVAFSIMLCLLLLTTVMENKKVQRGRTNAYNDLSESLDRVTNYIQDCHTTMKNTEFSNRDETSITTINETSGPSFLIKEALAFQVSAESSSLTSPSIPVASAQPVAPRGSAGGSPTTTTSNTETTANESSVGASTYVALQDAAGNLINSDERLRLLQMYANDGSLPTSTDGIEDAMLLAAVIKRMGDHIEFLTYLVPVIISTNQNGTLEDCAVVQWSRNSLNIHNFVTKTGFPYGESIDLGQVPKMANPYYGELGVSAVDNTRPSPFGTATIVSIDKLPDSKDDVFATRAETTTKPKSTTR